MGNKFSVKQVDSYNLHIYYLIGLSKNTRKEGFVVPNYFKLFLPSEERSW